MGKAKTTSTQLPRGFIKPQLQRGERKHFDYVEALFAEEHYGKYLVVKNTASNSQNHNRLYLCFDAHLEFIKPKIRHGMFEITKKSGIADIQLISRFPKLHYFIWQELSILIENSASRNNVERLLKGFGHLLSVFNRLEINISTLQDLDGSHVKAIENDAKNNSYLRYLLKSCNQFLRYICEYYGKNLYIPELGKYGFSKNRDDDISLGISWQCDIYACQDLDEIMLYVNEYRDWMQELEVMQAPFSEEELALHGGLFTLKNLVFTYFENFSKFGSGCAIKNEIFRKIAYQLYGIELRVWKGNRGCTAAYRKRENELRKLGDGGIDISVQDERMFAIWHKIIAPEYPFMREFLSHYSFIHSSLGQWRLVKSGILGFGLESFDRRIVPGLQETYYLYLLSLCRSGLNQQPILNWRVWKDADGSYHIGEDSGMGRIVDGFKGRGNSIQTTALDREQRNYVDFWCTYATPLYQRSQNDHFFQYERHGNINTLGLDGIRVQFKGKSNFFNRHKIVDTVLLEDGALQEKRLTHINHEKIRKIKNLSEYLEGKEQWERQYRRGHKNGNTEIIYQQTAEFQESKQHRIVMTQNKLLEFFKDKTIVESNPKLQVFTGPLSNCKNPFEPDYEGAKKLRDRDVCSNWRKCLSGCSQCQPVKNVHGPNIMAWIIVMDEMRSIYTDSEEWERMFLLDQMAAEAALIICNFSDVERVECEKKANEHGRLAFIRREVLNSQRSRRLNEDEKENGYI